MFKKHIIIFFTILLTTSLFGQKSAIQPFPKIQLLEGKRTMKIKHRKSDDHSKLVAATLDITLGLFGVHRLYLGTSPQVPVIYTLTLGGGGFLVLSDLGVILFTKDLEQFADDPHVIMWAESNGEK
ncbi:MAG: TM2 domain-containing protein [Flavobacteriales bacterium]|nr:TM2 domain-containing protein [Flavobacteriales bacterium]